MVAELPGIVGAMQVAKVVNFIPSRSELQLLRGVRWVTSDCLTVAWQPKVVRQGEQLRVEVCNTVGVGSALPGVTVGPWTAAKLRKESPKFSASTGRVRVAARVARPRNSRD
jgi:hypothetical protein